MFVDFSRGEKNRPFRSMIGSLLHTLRSYAELAEPSSWIVTHALTTHPFTSTFNSRQSLISHAAGREGKRKNFSVFFFQPDFFLRHSWRAEIKILHARGLQPIKMTRVAQS